MIGSSVTNSLWGINTEIGSLIIVDSSLVLYGNPQIVRMRGLGTFFAIFFENSRI